MSVVIIGTQNVPASGIRPLKLYLLGNFPSFYFAVSAKLKPRMPIPKNANAMHVLLL